MSGTQAICTPSPPHTIAQATGPRLAHFVKGLWRAYWAGRARRASVFYLSSLDERTLQDIGLHRSEIESVVYAKSKDRRGRYEPNWE